MNEEKTVVCEAPENVAAGIPDSALDEVSGGDFRDVMKNIGDGIVKVVKELDPGAGTP